MSLKKQTLTFLSQNPRMRVPLKDLARHLKVKGKEEYRGLRALIEDLDRRGVVTVDDRERSDMLWSIQTAQRGRSGRGGSPGSSS